MAKGGYYNNDFFTRLDNILNTTLIDLDEFILRYIYGAIYSYYKFGLGRPENIAYFERLIPEYSEGCRKKIFLNKIILKR